MRAEVATSVAAVRAVEAIGARCLTEIDPDSRRYLLFCLLGVGVSSVVAVEGSLALVDAAVGRVRRPRWAIPTSEPQNSIKSLRSHRHLTKP